MINLSYYFIHEEDGEVFTYYAGSPGALQLEYGFLSEPSTFTLPEGAELVGVDTYALSPVTSSTGLKGILLEILGPYDNIVTQYQYRQNNSTSYSYVNEVTPDYPWIASAALFIVLVWSLFSLVKRGMSWMR